MIHKLTHESGNIIYRLTHGIDNGTQTYSWWFNGKQLFMVVTVRNSLTHGGDNGTLHKLTHGGDNCTQT